MQTIGSRAEVWHGNAHHTSGGLTKKNLLKNKWGRIVSAKKHRTAKKDKRLQKAGFFAKKGAFGVVKRGGMKGGEEATPSTVDGTEPTSPTVGGTEPTSSTVGGTEPTSPTVGGTESTSSTVGGTEPTSSNTMVETEATGGAGKKSARSKGGRGSRKSK